MATPKPKTKKHIPILATDKAQQLLHVLAA